MPLAFPNKRLVESIIHTFPSIIAVSDQLLDSFEEKKFTFHFSNLANEIFQETSYVHVSRILFQNKSTINFQLKFMFLKK
jgi:hypothetical protein